MTGVIAETLCKYLDEENILPEEQKGCRIDSRRTKDQHLIDKVVLRCCKRRHTSLAMASIDYGNTYEMVPDSWTVECRKSFGVEATVQNFLIDSMKTWKTDYYRENG